MMESEDLSQETVPEQRKREAVPLGLGKTQGPARGGCLAAGVGGEGWTGRSYQAGKT